jgi:hypothetical protein
VSGAPLRPPRRMDAGPFAPPLRLHGEPVTGIRGLQPPTRDGPPIDSFISTIRSRNNRNPLPNKQEYRLAVKQGRERGARCRRGWMRTRPGRAGRSTARLAGRSVLARARNRRSRPGTVAAGRPRRAAIGRGPSPSAAASSASPMTSTASARRGSITTPGSSTWVRPHAWQQPRPGRNSCQRRGYAATAGGHGPRAQLTAAVGTRDLASGQLTVGAFNLVGEDQHSGSCRSRSRGLCTPVHHQATPCQGLVLAVAVALRFCGAQLMLRLTHGHTARAAWARRARPCSLTNV